MDSILVSHTVTITGLSTSYDKSNNNNPRGISEGSFVLLFARVVLNFVFYVARHNTYLCTLAKITTFAAQPDEDGKGGALQ